MKKITVSEALDKITEASLVLETEEIEILESAGRVLAKDIFSDIDVNLSAESSRDGFALNSEETKDASNENKVKLKIQGCVGAGELFEGELKEGSAIRIMTGAPLPKGSNCVVMREEVAEEFSDNKGEKYISIDKNIEAGTYVNPAASEYKKGDLVFNKGKKIVPLDVGQMALTGNNIVSVYRKPVVGVISIGSELVDSSETPKEWQKRDSNRKTLAMLTKNSGANAIIYPLVSDNKDEIFGIYEKAVEDCDIVVSSGGSCSGDFDFAKDTLSKFGEMIFEGILMKPGSSQKFAVSKRQDRNVLLFGLSGSPGAAYVGYFVLVETALRKMMGLKDCVDSSVLKIIEEHEGKEEREVRFSRDIFGC